MHLTAAHWVYAAFVIVVVATMAFRRDALIPCILGTLTLGWVITGTPLGAVQTVFKSVLVATRELLGIILVISVIVGLTTHLDDIGAGKPMVEPVKKLMKSPLIAFWVVGVVMMIASYFIWPSPAAALIGAIIIPAAALVGLPRTTAAVSLSIFGYGIALSTDYVIQGAPSITGKAANISVEAVMRGQIPLIVTMTIVSVLVAFWMARKEISQTKESSVRDSEAIESNALEPELDNVVSSSVSGPAAVTVAPVQTGTTRVARIAAAAVPLVYVATVAVLVIFKVRGTEATTIIGGITLLLLTGTVLLSHGLDGFNRITGNLVSGFSFGMKVFTQVIIIASFFYLGSPQLAPEVFGPKATGLLFDLAKALSNVLPLNRFTVGAIEAAVGCVVGLDGSAFAGLPLTGSLAGSFGAVAHLRVETVAGLGQIASVWVGGALVPWGVLAVGASMCGVSPMELAKRNFIPIMAGLAATTIVAVILM